MKSIASLALIAVLAACSLRTGSAFGQSDLNTWAEDCTQGPTPDQKKCELVSKLQGPLEGHGRLVALGVTVTSRDGHLVWTAIRGLKPRSAGIIVGKGPVLFSFNCSEEYCFFRGNADFILRQMRFGQTATVRITGPSWEQHDFVFSLRGFASLYQKAWETAGPGANGSGRDD